MPQCKCGCGGDVRDGVNFLRGHNMRKSAMKKTPLQFLKNTSPKDTPPKTVCFAYLPSVSQDRPAAGLQRDKTETREETKVKSDNSVLQDLSSCDQDPDRKKENETTLADLVKNARNPQTTKQSSRKEIKIITDDAHIKPVVDAVEKVLSTPIVPQNANSVLSAPEISGKDPDRNPGLNIHGVAYFSVGLVIALIILYFAIRIL